MLGLKTICSIPELSDSDLGRVPDAVAIEELRKYAAETAVRRQRAGIRTYPETHARWLSEPLDGGLLRRADLSPVVQVRAERALLRAGYRRTRDLLLAGTNKVDKVPNLGEKSSAALKEVLAAEFETPWRQRPAAAEAAIVCADLSEASIVALADSPIAVSLHSLGRLVGETTVSVQDVLDIDGDTDPFAFSGAYDDSLGRIGHLRTALAERAIAPARLFALDFYIAQ